MGYALISNGLLLVVIFYFAVRVMLLKRRLKEMEMLKEEIYYLGENMTTMESMEEAYELILESALKIISKVDKGSVLIEDEDGLFRYKAFRGYPGDLRMISLKKEEIYLYKYNNFSDTAIITKPYEYDKGILHKDKFHELLSSGELDRIYSVLSSPIKIKGKLIGIINIDSMTPSVSFNQEDINTMNHIKNELELSLSNFLSQERYKYTSTHDELTDLYNRRILRKFLNAEIHRVKEKKYKSYFVLMDLDDFKSINDNYGHDEGDRALIGFSNHLRSLVDKDGICVRMSGDEFVAILCNISLQEVEERLSILQEKACIEINHNQPIFFSYGITPIGTSGAETFEDIFRQADNRMYYEKKRKKKKVFAN